LINIILAENHNFILKCLRTYLSSECGFCIVGEAKDGREALNMVEELKPDILIIDISIPLINGLQVTRIIKQVKTKTEIIILSLHCNESYVFESLRAGAKGYVLKESPPEELIKAIKEVQLNNTYLSCQNPDLILEMFNSGYHSHS
jgi:two-component system nitrate/nitrite response regulator NarL